MTTKKNNNIEEVNCLNDLTKLSLVSIDSFDNDEFTKSNNFLNKFYSELDIYDMKIINRLLYVFNTYSKMNKKNFDIQEMFKNIVYKDGVFIMKLQDLISLTKTTNTLHSINFIDERLTKIGNTSFKYLKEDKNGILGNVTTRFITKHTIYKKGENVNQSEVHLNIDKELFEDIFSYTKVGYTTLNINMNKLKSKVSLGLYEELKRITPLKEIKKNSRGSIDVSENSKKIHKYTLEDLNKMFGTNLEFKTHIIRKMNIRYKQLLDFSLIEDIYTFTKDKNYIYIDIKREELNLDKKKLAIFKNDTFCF